MLGSGPNLRMSFITYSCKGNIILLLTSDREEIQRGLDRLKYSFPAGFQNLEKAFQKANLQIERANSGGVWVPSTIISVMIRTIDNNLYQEAKVELLGLSDKEEGVFEVKLGFKGLQEVVEPLASKTCAGISSLEEDTVCAGGQWAVFFVGQEQAGVRKEVSTPMSPPLGGTGTFSAPILALLLGSPVGTMGIQVGVLS
ncbi:Anthrax toxin receptor-like protein [Heterocephalus glaber]|uniref:Anthrax toxin receptor-like protein n=1 Tax=Heterocephalus glaber TaxID=10181 RepID=G5AM48_HETGA|nr:Anthrax toxin receptor-like protein [Heterocephalus glaber]